MKQIYCECCGSFQPLVEEPMHEDSLNPYPWGDLICGTCRFVIATLREIPEPAPANGTLEVN